jgi:hypothetical protein
MKAVFALAVILSLPGIAAADFRMSALARVGIEDLMVLDSFVSQPEISIPDTVSVAAMTSLFNIQCAEAAVAPFSMQLFGTGNAGALSRPTAIGEYYNAEIVFDDSSQLRGLLEPGSQSIDLLLNFQFAVSVALPELGDPEYPGLTWTGADVSASFSVRPSNPSLTSSDLSGSLQRFDSRLSPSMTTAGFFAGLTSQGGQVNVAVPLSISPFVANGLQTQISSSASISFSATGGLLPATVGLRYDLFDGPGLITTLDGESLSDLGVAYSLSPTPMVQFDGNDVPGIRHCSPGGGTSQTNAILPNLISAGFFQFFNVPTNNWFDPPTADAFEYQITSELGSFTDILDFPTGFSDEFMVSVGGIMLPGTFGPGDHIRFADYYDLLGDFILADSGVSQFLVSGIRPGVDPTSDTAFPLKLGFSTPTVDFSMRPMLVPEPSTWLLATLGSIAVGVYAPRRSRRSR